MANKPLVLVVDAQIDGLSKSLRDGKTVLADFGKSAQDMLADLRTRMGEAGNDVGSGAIASQMSSNLQKQMQGMRRAAQEAISQGKDFDPLGGMDSASALKAADSYEQMAKAMRDRADASARAAEAGNGDALVLKQLTVASEVAAEEFERLAASMRTQGAAFGAVEAEMGATANAGANEVVAAHGRMGISGQMLMHSVRSASDSFAAGLPPMMIFSEQISRVSEAMVYAAQESGKTEGALAKFAGVMSGPWGIAITAGISILGTLIGEMDLFKDKAVENAKALDDVKAGDDGLSEAQKVLGEMFDLTSGKLEHQNEMLRLNARLTAEKLRAQALSDRAQSDKTLGTASGWQQGLSVATIAQGLVANVLPGSVGNVGDQMARAQQLQAKINTMRTGKVSREDALRWAEGFDFDGLSISRQTFAQALIGQVQAEQETKTADLIDQSLDTNTLAPGLRKEAKERKTRARAPKKDPTPANDDAYNQLWDRLAGDAVGIGGQNQTSIEQVAERARAKVEADLRKQLDQIDAQGRERDWSTGDIDQAKTFAQLNASGKTSEINAKERRDIADRDLEHQRQALTQQDTLLQLQGQLATNLKDRRDIALKLLANQKQSNTLAVQKDVNQGKITGDEGAQKIADINAKSDLQTQQVQRQYASPMAAYKQQLVANISDINTALEGIEVSGVEGLENAFAGLVSGSESADQAIKSMVTSVIGQLGKLAAQQFAFSIFGLSSGGKIPGRSTGGLVGYATGGLPGFAGGTRGANGMISGPGTGTSDSILALVNGKDPIMVSNEEGIVNAKAVRDYWPIIDSMNKGTYPKFATGGALGRLSYPSLPSAGSVRGGQGMVLAPLQFDLRGAITTPQLMQQMVSISQQHATAALAAAPGMAQQQINDTANQRIPT